MTTLIRLASNDVFISPFKSIRDRELLSPTLTRALSPAPIHLFEQEYEQEQEKEINTDVP